MEKIGKARKRTNSLSGLDAINWSIVNNNDLAAISCAREIELPPNEVPFHVLGVFASNQKIVPAPSYTAISSKVFTAWVCLNASRNDINASPVAMASISMGFCDAREPEIWIPVGGAANNDANGSARSQPFRQCAYASDP